MFANTTLKQESFMSDLNVSPDSSQYPFIWWYGRTRSMTTEEIQKAEAEAIDDEAPAGAIGQKADGWALVTELRDVNAINLMRTHSTALYNKAIEIARENDDEEFLKFCSESW
jgi:hypothetical protein